MLNLGWGEFLIIGMVALIFIGPKELPGLLRTVGQWMTKLRRMASEFQSQFQEAMREAEMAELKKEVDDLTAQAKSYADFDPIGDVRREIEHTQHQIESAADKPADTSSTLGPTPEPASTAGASAPNPPQSGEAAAATNAPMTAPAPAELETVGPAAEPVKSDAGGKPA
jgi:sec-independent protein translocase protein TatB